MPAKPPAPRPRPKNTAHVAMYCSALASGVALILFGHATPVEASGYVAPFLVVFERLSRSEQ